MPKHETRNTFYRKHFIETQSGNEIWPVFVMLQKKNFHLKILQKMWPGN